MDDSPTAEPLLNAIAALLDGVPGLSGAEFLLGNTTSQIWRKLETTAGVGWVATEERTHLVPLRAGRQHHGWLRLRHDPALPLAGLAAELGAIGRMVGSHLGRRRSAEPPDRTNWDTTNRDKAETRVTVRREPDRNIDHTIMAAVARAQGAALRGEPAGEALAPLLAILMDVTGSQDVRIADGGLDLVCAITPLSAEALSSTESAISAILESEARNDRMAADLSAATNRADRAEFADLAKTEFLATMSHELRTPLNAILGFSELLQNQTFGPLGGPISGARYVGYATDIHDSGRLLLQIISDIMDVAKVETGRIHLAHDWVDTRQLLSSVVRLIEPRAAAADIAFEMVVSGEPLPRLWADERLVKQALLNILSNAVKFTPRGGSIRLTATPIDLGEGDAGLAVEITDTGLGIAESELTRVFEPFHRGDGATNRKFEGTGLGLPLARSFIDLHGGSLTLDSVQGAGTTVRISLPPARADIAAE
ncbi:hypothetical protein N825_02250 [Skermanella stibiiresistens SB22]|uniref:histidine kinase n=1 Tax=Skermanella stibiiresistens SB22 TaxID=1385369 RepID=W9HA71_9PROT|nr:hypothetical protein N825_02250 [Skermanella stibiiresistens SB22]